MGADLNPTMFGGTRRHAPQQLKQKETSAQKLKASAASKFSQSRRPRANALERAATPHMLAFDGVAPPGSRFLGIDVGLHFGWALLDERGGRIGSGVLRFDRYNDPLLRAEQIETRITGLFVQTAKPTSVAYEIVWRHEGVQAAHVYGMIESSVLRACRLMQLRPETVEVAAVKQAACGRGRADKGVMLAAARLRWGSDAAVDDNEADALFVAEVLRRRHAEVGR